MDNKLFICGPPLSNSNSKRGTMRESQRSNGPDSQNIFSSSPMYSVNLLKDPITLEVEVNSCHLHYYPTLSCLRNEYIIVIGGYKSKKCEYYSNSNRKWKELPDLPEERYGSVSVCDNTYNAIYCFGGNDSSTKKNCMSVFKLNVNIGEKWETLLAMENSEYLAKQFSCVIKRENGHIIILGGKNSNGQACDEIIDVEITGKKITVNLKKFPALSKNLKFQSLRSGEENQNGYLYLFDDEADDTVHRIDSKYSSIIKLNKLS